VRIWSAGCRSRYRQFTGRVQFVRRPLCVVGTVLYIVSLYRGLYVSLAVSVPAPSTTQRKDHYVEVVVEYTKHPDSYLVSVL